MSRLNWIHSGRFITFIPSQTMNGWQFRLRGCIACISTVSHKWENRAMLCLNGWWTLAQSRLVVDLTCRHHTSWYDTISMDTTRYFARNAFSRSPVTQSEPQELNRFLVLKHVPLIQILDHVPVPLDQDLWVLLSMTELLVTISLDPFQEVRHEGRLLFHQLLLQSLVFLLVTL